MASTVQQKSLDASFRPQEKDGMIYGTLPEGGMVLFDNVGQALLAFETCISNGGYGGHMVYNRMPDNRIQVEITNPPKRSKLNHYVTLLQPEDVLAEIKVLITEEKSKSKDRVNKITVFEPFDRVLIKSDHRNEDGELCLEQY